MTASELRALRQLARAHGVQLSYLSASGEDRAASPESLIGVLGALGCPVTSPRELPDRVAEAQRRRWQQPVEPVIVAWNGKPSAFSLRRPARATGRDVRIHLILADGSTRALSLGKSGLRSGRQSLVDGARFRAQSVALPALPDGYHRLVVETDAGVFEALIISAPRKSYSPPEDSKRLGVFLPMYATHSERSWGAGNISDWQRLGRWASAHGVTVMAGLPLLAAFLDQPTCEPSPYSPASRLFWNEFYLDVERIPEFAHCADAKRLASSPAFQRQLSDLRQRREIDYSQEMQLRRRVLERLAGAFYALPSSSPRRRELQRFLRERPEVKDYAAFRAACDRLRMSWHTWPARARNGRLSGDDFDPAVAEYYAYVQWLAQQQMAALVDESCSRGLNLYLDLPLGVHPDSYDVWRERDLFTLRASAGAPPDPFFSKGQDWGFAPLHPQVNRERAYQYILQYLRFQMRHTGLLRIDHVMGLHRLYWIPHGLPPTEGAYVTYPADELYALLSLESHQHRTTIVGENLGTVPPQVNLGMKRHRLRQMYVVQYELQPDPGAALRPPPELCVASVNTHDMPTFAAHWHGEDIADRAALGLVPRGKLGEEKRQRAILKNALLKFLRKRKALPKNSPAHAKAVLHACLKWLSASPAEVVLLNLEDLWLERQPQNVPGTYKERPNWRRKAQLTLEQIEAHTALGELLNELNTSRTRLCATVPPTHPSARRTE